MKRERVRCDRCGFLALRQLRDKQLVETNEHYRNKVNTAIWDMMESHEGTPLCFVRHIDIQKIVYEAMTKAGELRQDVIFRIVHKERYCNDFTKWVQGFTPKEHYEMTDREKWREWQRSDRKWHIIGACAQAFIIAALAGLFAVISIFWFN